MHPGTTATSPCTDAEKATGSHPPAYTDEEIKDDNVSMHLPKEDATKFTNIDSNSKIEVFDVKQYNVLILGESRAGKTTFRKVLRNINHKTKIKVCRGTVNPTTKYTLFSIDGKFIAVNMLDTPGFAEASDGISRSDSAIRSTITEYVKQNIVKLDLILIAINGASGLTGSQIKNITSVLKFLGRQVASRTCMLVTHFENQNIEDEKKWVNDFTTNSNMKFLTRACEAGFLFTGALNKNQFDNITVRDSYILQQKRRNLEFFKTLTSGETVSLMSQQMKDAKSMFAMQESVLTACISIKNLIPEVEATWQHAIDRRLAISKAIEEKLIKDSDLLARAQEVVAKLSSLGADGKDIKTMKLDENVVKMMQEYEAIGNTIQEKYIRVMELSGEFTELDQIATLLCDELEWSI